MVIPVSKAAPKGVSNAAMGMGLEGDINLSNEYINRMRVI